MIFAAIRTRKIRSLAELRNVERHGRRQDSSSQRRADLRLTSNSLSWSAVDDPLAVVDAFRERKARTGAKEYGKACLAMHTLCIVSPQWIAEGGDVHDPQNPRNTALFEQARAWADETYGKGSCIAARMDLDETGAGLVDLVIVPVRNMTMRGQSKPIISVNKAVDEAFGKTKSYAAMQDSWASWAKKHLDPCIQRGITKDITQREHVHADIIGPALARQEAVNANIAAAREELRSSSMKAKQALSRERQEAHDEGFAAGLKAFSSLGVYRKIAAVRASISDEAARTAREAGSAAVREELMPRISELSLALKVEQEKNRKLEAGKLSLTGQFNALSAELRDIEAVISEVLYEKLLSAKIALRIRQAFSSAPALDNILETFGFHRRSNSFSRSGPGNGPDTTHL